MDDAPEPEIEITPEMLEAGAEVIGAFSPTDDCALEVAAEVYRAMARVHLASR